MTETLHWVVSRADWNEGALAASWAFRTVLGPNVSLRILPLLPSEGPAIPFPEGVIVEAPVWDRRPRRAGSRALGVRLHGAPRIVIDWDRTMREILSDRWDDALERTLLFVHDEHWRPQEAHLFPRVHRVLAANAGVFFRIAQTPGILPSRTFLLPPLPLWAGPPERRLHSEVPWIVVMGALTAVKGMDAAVNAVAELLHHRQRDFHMLWLGDGPERERLLTYARAMGVTVQVVSSMGEWAGFLEQATVLLAPQFEDGLGWDVAEAVRRGMPVVAGDLPVMRERFPRGDLCSLTVINMVEALLKPLVPNRPSGEHVAAARLAWREAIMG